MPFFFELLLLYFVPYAPGRSREEAAGAFAPEWDHCFLVLVQYPRETPKIRMSAALNSEVVRAAFVHGAALPRKMKTDPLVCDEPVMSFSVDGVR